MALEFVMKVLGFLASTVSPLCLPQVRRPCMHRSALYVSTPFVWRLLSALVLSQIIITISVSRYVVVAVVIMIV